MDEGYSSDSDPDVGMEEHAQSKGPYWAPNRSKHNTQGSSASEDENQSSKQRVKRTNYFRPQSFVPATSQELGSNDQEHYESSDSSGEESSDDPMSDVEGGGPLHQNNPEGAPSIHLNNVTSAATRTDSEEAEEPIPSRGGIGSKPGRDSHHDMFNMKRIPDFTKEGIGAKQSPFIKGSAGDTNDKLSEGAVTNIRSFNAHGLPSSFGQSSAFTQKVSQTQLETRHHSSTKMPKVSFNTGSGLGGGFNPSSYLASMGWTGGGLGKQGEGIVNPIEVKQRPERAGIAFGGLKEKTKQAKIEARRRGEQVSSDEDEHRNRHKTGQKRNKLQSKTMASESHAWTKAERKPRKPKIEHRTYEQILAEHGHSSLPQAGVGPIVDASGKEYTSISAALAKHAVPTSDTSQLVEIRHNLQLICDANVRDLRTLADEGSAIVERHKWLERDRDESNRRKALNQKLLERVNNVTKVVRELESIGKRCQGDNTANLDVFSEPIHLIIKSFNDAIEEFSLDEAIVGSIIPVFRRIIAQWDPLQDPTLMTASLQKFRPALRCDVTLDVMSPYSSLLWNIWMPHMRSSLNNNWDVWQPDKAVCLYRAWSPLLPRFINDNITQQIILPKIRSAIADWDGKRPLFPLIFPWMPVLNEQLGDVIAEAKRQVRSSLKGWKISNGVPSELLHWKEFYNANEWNSMLLHHIVDKLSNHLEKNFIIDPQAQDIKALEDVIVWEPHLPAKVMSKLLLARFVSPWLRALHSWLVSSAVNFDQVAQWYEHWKSWFQDHKLFELHGIQVGFNGAIQLMDAAIEMGDQRDKLPMPDIKDLLHEHIRTSDTQKVSRNSNQHGERTVTDDTTFRQVVEDAASEADLLVLPLNRTEMKNGRPLYRLSRTIDGKKGTTFYLEEDVVWAERRDDSAGVSYEPQSISDMIKTVT